MKNCEQRDTRRYILEILINTTTSMRWYAFEMYLVDDEEKSWKCAFQQNSCHLLCGFVSLGINLFSVHRKPWTYCTYIIFFVRQTPYSTFLFVLLHKRENAKGRLWLQVKVSEFIYIAITGDLCVAELITSHTLAMMHVICYACDIS